MSMIVSMVDREDLPVSLLALAKSHLRVDHVSDDSYIRHCIFRAIGRLEGKYGVTINATTAIWTPATTEFDSTGATLPARPASSFTAVAGQPPADASANYSLLLKWDDIYGVPIQILKGAAASGLSVTLKLGFTDETLPAELVDLILLQTAHLYENREILTPDKPYAMPDLAPSATWWMPRI
jgi:uncharacterized phiE125 gp8 family phage protein